uniref:Uncharacterized protein n=1 Tax=Escherichia coli TaxID=562 RepID=A0A7U1E1S3_ECOLX|nr:hypothetical protein [Escherichia coli]
MVGLSEKSARSEWRIIVEAIRRFWLLLRLRLWLRGLTSTAFRFRAG